jgi:Ca2+-binding RTX toxin-like protein
VRHVAAIAAALALTGSSALADGGPARRELVGTAGPDTLLGTRASELMRGLAGDDELYAGGGADEVVAGPGEDHVYGGDGDDLLWGSNRGEVADLGDYRRERLLGGAGRDVLASAMAGAVLIGGTGDDELHALGRPGCRIDLDARRRLSDAPGCVIWLLGGPGRDRLWARNGASDVVVCGRADVLVNADRIDRVYEGC